MQNKSFFGDIFTFFCFIDFNDLGDSIDRCEKYTQISDKLPLKHLIILYDYATILNLFNFTI